MSTIQKSLNNLLASKPDATVFSSLRALVATVTADPEIQLELSPKAINNYKRHITNCSKVGTLPDINTIAQCGYHLLNHDDTCTRFGNNTSMSKSVAGLSARAIVLGDPSSRTLDMLVELTGTFLLLLFFFMHLHDPHITHTHTHVLTFLFIHLHSLHPFNIFDFTHDLTFLFYQFTFFYPFQHFLIFFFTNREIKCNYQK